MEKHTGAREEVQQLKDVTCRLGLAIGVSQDVEIHSRNKHHIHRWVELTSGSRSFLNVG